MVSRSTLALIIILMVAGGMLAQEPDSTYFAPQAIEQHDYYISQSKYDYYSGWVVTLKIEIFPDSTLGEITTVIGSGVDALDSLVVESLEDWKFEPATINGEPVAGTLLINIPLTSEAPSASESARIDTTLATPYLMKQVEDKLSDLRYRYNRRFLDTRYVFAQENFHLYAPYQTTFHFTRNRFIQSELPVSGTQILQLMKTLYPIANDAPVYHLETPQYICPVSLTETQLGTGDKLMNHAYVNYMKGRLFGVREIDANFQFLAYEGEMFEENEQCGDYVTHLVWHSKLGDLYLDNDILNHDITSIKMKKVYQPKTEEYAKERLWDHSVYWDNRWLDIGYKYQRKAYRIKNHADEAIDETNRYYILHAGDSLFYQQIDLTAQSRDFEHDSWLAEHRLDIGGLHSHAAFMREFGYDQHKSLKIAWGDSIAVQAGYRIEGERQQYLQRRYEFRESGWFAGMRFLYEAGWILLDLDWRLVRSDYKTVSRPDATIDIDTTEENVLGTDCLTRVQTILGRFLLNINSKVDYRQTDKVIELPRWKISSEAELVLDVGHDNAMKLGVRQTQVAGYNDWREREVDSTRILDGWFGIQITKQFQINLEGYNLTSADNLFDKPAHGAHYNFTLHWQFVN